MSKQIKKKSAVNNFTNKERMQAALAHAAISNLSPERHLRACRVESFDLDFVSMTHEYAIDSDDFRDTIAKLSDYDNDNIDVDANSIIIERIVRLAVSNIEDEIKKKVALIWEEIQFDIYDLTDRLPEELRDSLLIEKNRRALLLAFPPKGRTIKDARQMMCHADVMKELMRYVPK